MAGWAIQVEGERDLRRALREAGKSVTHITRPHRSVVRLALKQEKAAAPVRSGRLRRSGKGRATSTKAEVRFSTPYVRKQEFRPHGPRSMRSSGWYFLPEAERRKEEWFETYWRELRAELDKAWH